MAADISPISSMNRVPPLAASKRPTREVTAPLNAPLRWPNSSVSSSVSGSAPQLIDTNGRPARLLRRWMVRATSSLPVPLSPWISTGLSVAATRPITPSTSFTAGLSPMIEVLGVIGRVAATDSHTPDHAEHLDHRRKTVAPGDDLAQRPVLAAQR